MCLSTVFYSCAQLNVILHVNMVFVSLLEYVIVLVHGVADTVIFVSTTYVCHLLARIHYVAGSGCIL